VELILRFFRLARLPEELPLQEVYLASLPEDYSLPRHPLALFWAAVRFFSALLLHLAHSPAERLRQLLPSGCCTGVCHRVFQMCQDPVSPEDSHEHAKHPAFRQLFLP
jgi:hypothetical protein